MRRALAAGLILSGAILALRFLFGPGRYIFSVHSPMNAEGVFALLFLGLLLCRDERTSGTSRGSAFLLIALVAAGFVSFLDFPLLADDYSHIWNARHADAHALLAHFTQPETDRFFRPVGYLSYALDATWAGLHPVAWRAGSLLLHLANTLLVFWLCLETGMARMGALAGALIFGLHGSRPEAVTWVAARFDLLAVFFGLLCVLAVLRGWHSAVCGLLLLLALWSKESAYLIPLVVAAVLRFRRLPVMRRVAPLLAIAAVSFAYRTLLLGGIGGYRDPASGSATILSFKLTSTLKALFPRFWGAMLFPVNWTGELNTALKIMWVLAIAALVYLAWRGADRRKVLLGVAIATLCSLPVHQFLSIGPDLEKSRVLYLASAGLAILFGAIFETASVPALLCLLCLAGFQFTALESNLAIWKRVGFLADRTCGDLARRAPTTVPELPNVVDGVYFLHTGFPECVWFRAPSLAWDPAARTLR